MGKLHRFVSLSAKRGERFVSDESIKVTARRKSVRNNGNTGKPKNDSLRTLKSPPGIHNHFPKETESDAKEFRYLNEN